MKITRTSPYSGKTVTLDLPITYQQWADWKNGAYIQDAMRNLTADEREFILSGILPGEWEEMWGEEEDSLPDNLSGIFFGTHPDEKDWEPDEDWFDNWPES